MAGTLTVTRNTVAMKATGKKVEKIQVAWTSDASGNADVSIEKVHGYILKLVTDPDGTAAPTDNYDITLVDEHGADVLADGGLNRDTANIEAAYPAVSGAAVPVFAAGTVTFTVANAGNAKAGVATLYVCECL